MVNRLPSDLLSDTLNIVQLARQAALARGNQDRAGKLSSVADGLHKVASEATSTTSTLANGQQTSTSSSATLTQEGFQTLLAAVQNNTTPSPQSQRKPADASAAKGMDTLQYGVNERNNLVSAMAAGTMSEIEIARQLGITRDEVRAILSLNRLNTPSSGGRP